MVTGDFFDKSCLAVSDIFRIKQWSCSHMLMTLKCTFTKFEGGYPKAGCYMYARLCFLSSNKLIVPGYTLTYIQDEYRPCDYLKYVAKIILFIACTSQS